MKRHLQLLKRPARLPWRGAWLVLPGLLLLAGCAHVGPAEQRLVSKPNMTFSDSVVFNAPPRLFQQSEPGASDTGGAASAGCSSCR